MSDEQKRHREEALRRIGRNVVNFQRLEASLRQLIPSLSLAGPLSSLGNIRASREKELKKKSLGDLASRFQTEVFGADQSSSEPIQTEITIAHSFRFEEDSVWASERVKNLAKLVRERNRLMHSDLVHIDLESITECESLSARLDEQNQRVCEQIYFVNSLRKAQAEAISVFSQFITSEEFLKQLRSDRNDA